MKYFKKLPGLFLALALSALFVQPSFAASVYINGVPHVVVDSQTASALPTGAATAAKQPALGSTTVPSADVISVTSGIYPSGAVALTASSADVSAASAVATLGGTVAKTTYIDGFTCTSAGATGAATVVVALTGVITGTMNYVYTSIAGATLANTPLSVRFGRAIPASATNTAIVVTMPSLGTGNLHAACNANGFTL